eukprot:750086-Hanusia_phi.AAC.2
METSASPPARFPQQKRSDLGDGFSQNITSVDRCQDVANLDKARRFCRTSGDEGSAHEGPGRVGAEHYAAPALLDTAVSADNQLKGAGGVRGVKTQSEKVVEGLQPLSDQATPAVAKNSLPSHTSSVLLTHHTFKHRPFLRKSPPISQPSTRQLEPETSAVEHGGRLLHNLSVTVRYPYSTPCLWEYPLKQPD